MLPLWVIELIKKSFKHRFFYARLSRLPLLRNIIDWMFFDQDDMVYLPKDNVVLTINQKISYTNTVLPSHIVHRFIDEANTHFIMNFCICRDSNQCKDYPIDLGCLFMGEAASKIDPRLGKLVTPREAHQYVMRAREAGLVHLIGRNKLDAVWLDTGPDEKLLTVCNCCPCCCLWKMLPRLGDHISNKITAMPGVEIGVSSECTGCGACVETCFVDAIKLVNGCAIISDVCRGCGRCVEVCPQKAITLKIDPSSIEKTINRIDTSIDLKEK
ncbi:4Fe-4S ferredoxin [Candidatus Bathyarchaeota archaeon]|nr:4Fe-4S ferredoxin [Candidatus Bathyarchaeota archaeon]